jgi:hypothetical protein
MHYVAFTQAFLSSVPPVVNLYKFVHSCVNGTPCAAGGTQAASS